MPGASENPDGRHERIGVYGGSFDPIHNAHLDIARTALREAKLTRVLFVVAAQPPHKQGGTVATPEQRLAMVQAAVFGEPGMEASRLELDRKGPSYTVDTLMTLATLHPKAEFFLILGMDSLVDLPHWRDPNGILARARLLVVPRPGEWTVPPVMNGHYEILPFEKTVLSSTDVRARITSGEGVDDVLPRTVLRLIREKGIYGVAS